MKKIIILIVLILLISITLFKFFEYRQLKNSCLSKISDSKSDISVYFTPSATMSDILDFKKSIETLSEVASVVYISREEALANFRENHKDETLVLEALDKLNQNPMFASINIKVKELSKHNSIVNFLNENNISNGNSNSIIQETRNNIEGYESIIKKVSTVFFIDYIKNSSILRACGK
jgi:cell division transport system permease protein